MLSLPLHRSCRYEVILQKLLNVLLCYLILEVLYHKGIIVISKNLGPLPYVADLVLKNFLRALLFMLPV